MARLLDTLLRFDQAARLGTRVLGSRSDCGRAFAQACADLRRQLAPVALRQLADTRDFDPRADLMEILAIAEEAGLAWPDLVEAINHFHERKSGRD